MTPFFRKKIFLKLIKYAPHFSGNSEVTKLSIFGLKFQLFYYIFWTFRLFSIIFVQHYWLSFWQHFQLCFVKSFNYFVKIFPNLCPNFFLSRNFYRVSIIIQIFYTFYNFPKLSIFLSKFQPHIRNILCPLLIFCTDGESKFYRAYLKWLFT